MLSNQAERAGEEPGGPGVREDVTPGPIGIFPAAEQRLLRLMAEFRRRQRERPDLVVRPWLSHGQEHGAGPSIGFVLEYCPGGDAWAEVRVRHDRAVAEGPAGTREAGLDLRDGWLFEGADVRGPELMANHLLRLAGRALAAG